MSFYSDICLDISGQSSKTAEAVRGVYDMQILMCQFLHCETYICVFVHVVSIGC